MIRYKKIYNALKNKILNKNKKLWLPSDNFKYNTYNTNSWFKIEEHTSLVKNKIINKNISLCNDDGKIPENIIKSRKYYIYPNDEQKDILLNWMKYYIIMYNQTILYFRTNYFNKQKILLDWMKIRTNHLKNIKEIIIKNSQLKKYKNNTRINAHVLDQAIQEATKNYKACLTNIKMGNIKKFNLRYLKLTKPNKNITIEHVFISKNKNTFCSTIFREEFITPNFKFSDIKSDFKIQYEEKIKMFSILIPIKEKIKEKHNIKDTCGIDMGLRTFATCFSNNKIITIGNNMQDLIKKHIHKIDGINHNINIKNKRKKILENKYYTKMNNKIDDLHFKTINYLTNNFGNIIIGNLSTKDISSNLYGHLKAITKRIANGMRLYTFKQRLKYKCTQYKIGYKEVNEAYTSKMCSNCANYNKYLGSNKIYDCKNCNITLDRDVNASRNMLMTI